MENLKQWLQQVWTLNPQVPMRSVQCWVSLIIQISEIIDQETINLSDFKVFENTMRKFLKPWQKILIESQMDSFDVYYQRTEALLGATYLTSFPSNLLSNLFECAKYLLQQPNLTEATFLSGVSNKDILTWCTTVYTPEAVVDVPLLDIPQSNDFFESVCVQGNSSASSDPPIGSIYCYTSRCTKGLAMDKFGSTVDCKDLIVQLRLYNGNRMRLDGSNQYWNYKEIDCLYSMQQNSEIAGLAKQLLEAVNRQLSEKGATLKKSSKRYRPY
nr:nonstructural protein [Flumine parvovirus 3]